MPWYHFVPGMYDYSDLFDIMYFFSDGAGGGGVGRDELAQEIGKEGHAFAMERLRRVC